MPTPQDYILTFDFQSFTSQFSILQRSFTDFGEMIHRMADLVSEDLKGIQQQANEVFQTLSNEGLASDAGFSSFERHLKQTSAYLEDYQKKSSEISQKLKDISNTDLSKITTAVNAPQTLENKLSDIGDRGNAVGEQDAKSGSAEIKKQIAEVEKRTDDLRKNLEETNTKVSGFFDDLWKITEKEARNVKEKSKGLFSELTQGMFSGGGLIGMSLGFILMGYRDRQRKQAEKGEMLNVFEAGTAGVHGVAQKEAVTHFAKFQEKASHLYGIGKDEIQGLTKQFVDAGYIMTSKLGNFKNNLGEVGENAVQLTLGIDKLYNMATGTSATNVNRLVSDFGESLSDASQKYMELSFAAQRSGMGVEKFINSVMSGSQALSQYGVEMTDIKDIMQQLQRYYRDMGLDKQAAGGFAAEALKGAVGGTGGTGFQLLLAQRLFPGLSPLEAKMKMEAGQERLAKGEDVDFFKIYMKEKVNLLSEYAHGDKALAAQFAKEQGLFTDTNSFLAMWNLVKSGKIDSKEEADKREVDKQMKALKDSYITEGKALSDLQKSQYNLLQGLSNIGQGIMKILSGLLATLITGFHWLVTLPDRLSMSDKDREAADEKIDAAFKSAWGAIKGGWGDIFGKDKDEWGGVGQVAGALGQMFEPMKKGLDPALALVSEDAKKAAARFGESAVGEGIRDVGAGIADAFRKSETLSDFAFQAANNTAHTLLWSTIPDIMDEIGEETRTQKAWLDDKLGISGLNAGKSRSKVVPHSDAPVGAKVVVKGEIPGQAIKDSLNKVDSKTH